MITLVGVDEPMKVLQKPCPTYEITEKWVSYDNKRLCKKASALVHTVAGHTQPHAPHTNTHKRNKRTATPRCSWHIKAKTTSSWKPSGMTEATHMQQAGAICGKQNWAVCEECATDKRASPRWMAPLSTPLNSQINSGIDWDVYSASNWRGNAIIAAFWHVWPRD